MSTHETSDRELLRRAEAGDTPAFGVLFRRHATAVQNHCFRRLGTWGAAEDATSVVFLETWRRRADARDVDGSLRPWLLVVATNVTRNHLRSTRRHRAALERLPRPPTPPPETDEVDDRLAAEQRVRAVLSSVRGLRPSEQDVIALCVWDGLTYAEAGTALGLPAATVRSRLSRARAHLRELHHDDPDTTPTPLTTRAGGTP